MTPAFFYGCAVVKDFKPGDKVGITSESVPVWAEIQCRLDDGHWLVLISTMGDTRRCAPFSLFLGTVGREREREGETEEKFPYARYFAGCVRTKRPRSNRSNSSDTKSARDESSTRPRTEPRASNDSFRMTTKTTPTDLMLKRCVCVCERHHVEILTITRAHNFKQNGEESGKEEVELIRIEPADPDHWKKEYALAEQVQKPPMI